MHALKFLWLDQFRWLVKIYYWLGAGQYLPAFRRLKAVITNCITERRHKAREQKVWPHVHH